MSFQRIYRFGISFVTCVLFVYLGWACFDLWFQQHIAEQNMVDQIRLEVLDDIKHLDAELQALVSAVQEVSDELPSFYRSKPKIESILRRKIEEVSIIYGIAVVFSPQAFDPSVELYAPYMVRNSSRYELTHLEEHYDYTEEKHDFYHKPFQQGACWIEPYWGEAGKSMMATYGVPVYLRDAQTGERKPLAVVAADISFRDIWNLIGSINKGKAGYGFVLSKTGRTIAHPSHDYTYGGKSIYDIISDSTASHDALRQALESKTEAVVSHVDSVLGRETLTVIEPYELTGWFVGSSSIEEELLLSPKTKKRLWLIIVILGVLALASLFAVRLAYSNAENFTPHLIQFSFSTAACFAIGLLAIWALENRLGTPSPYQDAIIPNQNYVSNYIRSENQKAKDQHREPPVFIPTGILLRSIKLAGLDEVEITGIAWQRLPLDALETIGEGIRFPDSIETTMTEMYRQKELDAEVVGWTFNTTIRQTYDNTIYPFDRIDVSIRMRQKDLIGNLIFIPDFPSYNLTVPSMNPFVANNLSIPNWKPIQTYFKPYSHAYNMTYGFRQQSLDDYVRDMVLVVTLQREWVGTFISVLIPIFVLMAIAFASLLMISGDPDKVKAYDFKAQRMLMVGATFCLFLVIATVNLRERIISEKITYVEQLYFLLYFLILLNVLFGMGISRRVRFLRLDYNDGAIVRYLYWPIVLGATFFLTVFNFY